MFLRSLRHPQLDEDGAASAETFNKQCKYSIIHVHLPGKLKIFLL
jgi:hypothetical protein